MIVGIGIAFGIVGIVGLIVGLDISHATCY
jgi:hypothetical protein